MLKCALTTIVARVIAMKSTPNFKGMSITFLGGGIALAVTIGWVVALPMFLASLISLIAGKRK